MKPNFAILAALIFFAVSASVWCQTAETSTENSPFVQRLRVALKEPQVRISWEDESNITQNYLLYRHTEEITAANLSNASLVAELAKASPFFTDVPPKAGSWFYAVLIKDKSGNVYKVFIPYRNKTVSAIVIANDPIIEDLASDLSNIKALVSGQNIELSILSSRNNRKIALYRSSKIIQTFSDLTNAVLLTTSSGDKISYTDKPIPGVPYYYAAIDTEVEDTTKIAINLGKNSLALPVEINLSTVNLAGIRLPGARAVRPFPLPQIHQIQGPSDLPNRSETDLSPGLLSALNALLPKASPKASTNILERIKLLPSDRLLKTEDQGNAASLQEILRSYFTGGDYAQALVRLQKLSRMELSGETKIKTRYYIAQSKMALADYKGAILDFLLVRNDLSDYVEPWLELALGKL